MNILLINPELVVNPNDKFTTGIVYLPIALASISANLEKYNYNHKIIDLFGNNPRNIKKINNHLFIGDDINDYKNDINNSSAIFIFANQVINHLSILKIISSIRKINSNIKIFTFENTQAVTGYSLKRVYNEFIFSKNDFVIIGEPEEIIVKILQNIDNLEIIDGLIGLNFKNLNKIIIKNIDELPIPNWNSIPLNNYWKIKYAHGPFTSKKYLSILTSRGCPYPCNFCIIPETNDRKWRSKSPTKVVDEIEFYIKEHGVSEFHLEDLNPTINDKRIKEICKEIINRNLKIDWKIVAGTKVESIKDCGTIDLMAQSGCTYISISPESGSKELMNKINKPFDIDHAYKIVKQMNLRGIFSQACFVLGFPGEKTIDIKLTKKLIYNLAKAGVDEIAIFIITPIPGSNIFNQFNGYKNLSDLNFSPIWRKDYKKLNSLRIKYYIYFITLKTFFFPLKILKQIKNFILCNFQTKMEMIPYKWLKLTFYMNKH